MRIWYRSMTQRSALTRCREALERRAREVCSPGVDVVFHGVSEHRDEGRMPADILEHGYAELVLQTEATRSASEHATNSALSGLERTRMSTSDRISCRYGSPKLPSTIASKPSRSAWRQKSIPAEGILDLIVARGRVASTDGVSVQDCVATALPYAELLVNLRRRAGVGIARRGVYAKPPADLLAQLDRHR